MISRVFIDRPIFAAVLSIVITLTGGIALLSLPIAQYPPVTPPAVAVTINYPGANAQVVSDTVAAPIEQEVNGVEGMLYMSSQMGNDGSYTLTVTFDIGTDLNTALVMVQNRVQLAMPLLPTSVQNQGITIRKKTPDILNVINFYSPDGRYDDVYLSNFAQIHVYDELLRIDGVSQINFLGVGNYSMRAWLDPLKLASLNMTAGDVANAISTQNLDAPAGVMGQQPAPPTQAFELPIDTLGRLTTTEQFANLIVKTTAGQSGPPSNRPVTLSPGSSGISSPGSGGASQSGVTMSPSTTAPTSLSTSLTTPTTSAAGTNPGTTTRSSTSGVGAAAGTGGTTGTTTMTTGTGSSTTATAPTTGGPTTTGGAQSTGGGTTGGGANAITTDGGAGNLWRGLSISRTTSASAAGGVVPTNPSVGTGPGRPAEAIVRLRDVARIELGDQNYSLGCSFDGHPSAGLAVFQLPTSNALDVGNQIRAKMEELKATFPDGIEYQIAYDTTPFIRESVADVVHTLLEAVALVGLVVLVFLQNWRATLIPMVAVPVAVVGTFAVMAAIGFSLNNVSLFGLVLAIGIVVDDAIVVVENVERWLERGESPREAARKAMDEVTGPVIAVALVLCAVFVPCAFISGITGQFFRQFAMTVAVSTVLSAFNSLTLSPALAAILLKPRGTRRDPVTWLLDTLLGWFFRLFNRGFKAGTAFYVRLVGGLLRVSLIALLVYAGLLVLTYFRFVRAPTGFVPQQDKGYLLLNVQLPDSASVTRTQKVMAHIEGIARETPGVEHTVGISGQSLILNANAPNFGSLYVMLKPFGERTGSGLSADAIAAALRQRCRQEVRGAVVATFGAPPIDGLGTTGGFKLIVEDRGNLGLGNLQRVSDQIVARGNETSGLESLFNSSRASTPWLYLDIDRTKCMALGVPVSNVFSVLQVYLGSYYVNNFNEFGRIWQVNVQADPRFRDRVGDIRRLQVRNNQNQMVLLGTVLNVRCCC
jgi:multidrug efflux pump